jgi:hypothetical protein
MSALPDNEFDLEKLFLPAWAQQESSSAKYAKFEGEEERPERRGDRRGPRPPRREGRPGGRREAPGPRRGAGGPEGGWTKPPRVDRDKGEERRRDHRPEPRERREPPPPLVEVGISLVPEERGVESLARQIKMTGRAYPLFDIAQMILQKPERHVVVFAIKKNPEGQPIQPLFVCALDETLWLSEDEAIGHVLKKHFTTFYQPERTATEPPKGKYTFVAQCGMSGVVLGPPNHHDYQNQLRKLHAERYSRMPFDVYKARVRIVRDEEVVKKWVEDQSWKTEYLCLNMPEPLRLPTMDAVEKHFRENHKDNIVKPVETHTLSGTAARSLRSPELVRLVRSTWEDQRRFPLQIATVLSQQFATHGLQFFKVNKTITHVSVARPHYLDMSLTPVSEGVKRIVDYIIANPKCTRRQLVQALAPSPPAVAPATAAEPTGEKPAAAPVIPAPTAEQTAVNADLHWLIHQGHVIEFANGVLETAKKPAPKPPKPEAKPAQKPAETAPSEASMGEVVGTEPAAEAALPTSPEGPSPADGQAAEAVAPGEAPLPATNNQEEIKAAEPVSGDGKATEAPPPPGASSSAAPDSQPPAPSPATPLASP